MHFFYNGDYPLKEGINYSSSRYARLDEEELNGCTKLGDKYFPVICGKQIAIAYSEKLFKPSEIEYEKAYYDD